MDQTTTLFQQNLRLSSTSSDDHTATYNQTSSQKVFIKPKEIGSESNSSSSSVNSPLKALNTKVSVYDPVEIAMHNTASTSTVNLNSAQNTASPSLGIKQKSIINFYPKFQSESSMSIIESDAPIRKPNSPYNHASPAAAATTSPQSNVGLTPYRRKGSILESPNTLDVKTKDLKMDLGFSQSDDRTEGKNLCVESPTTVPDLHPFSLVPGALTLVTKPSRKITPSIQTLDEVS
jgi:hypothetical protein